MTTKSRSTKRLNIDYLPATSTTPTIATPTPSGTAYIKQEIMVIRVTRVISRSLSTSTTSAAILFNPCRTGSFVGPIGILFGECKRRHGLVLEPFSFQFFSLSDLGRSGCTTTAKTIAALEGFVLATRMTGTLAKSDGHNLPCFLGFQRKIPHSPTRTSKDVSISLKIIIDISYTAFRLSWHEASRFLNGTPGARNRVGSVAWHGTGSWHGMGTGRDRQRIICGYHGDDGTSHGSCLLRFNVELHHFGDIDFVGPSVTLHDGFGRSMLYFLMRRFQPRLRRNIVGLPTRIALEFPDSAVGESSYLALGLGLVFGIGLYHIDHIDLVGPTICRKCDKHGLIGILNESLTSGIEGRPNVCVTLVFPQHGTWRHNILTTRRRSSHNKKVVVWFWNHHNGLTGISPHTGIPTCMIKIHEGRFTAVHASRNNVR
eukprot:scaffold6480_cov165-Amphora_coffeaeformis.AAC.2